MLTEGHICFSFENLRFIWKKKTIKTKSEFDPKLRVQFGPFPFGKHEIKSRFINEWVVAGSKANNKHWPVAIRGVNSDPNSSPKDATTIARFKNMQGKELNIYYTLKSQYYSSSGSVIL